ncbi:MAG TPA: Smr/MutS family protein [Sphingomicrobium sp.]|nr:Smr/MutS family protein [Sphingomicrobium sp.]
MRPLTPDEAALWQRVTATIRPLSRGPVEAMDVAPVRVEPQKPAKSRPEPLRRTAAAPVKPASRNTLDGGWDRRLKAGTVSPDRTLDLHGHNLDRAYDAIDHALERAIAGGERVILLITGHARAGEPPIQRGRIRAAVHDWLAASRHAPRIAAVRAAHGRHGGGGSLYIILRRSDGGSTKY